MAEMNLDEGFFKEATSFDGPIPGESLMESPDASRPWEGPPSFTTKTEALEHYFDVFTSEDIYKPLMDSLNEGVSVMEILNVLLYQGFEEGLINPDMMLILAEPLAYMIAALAERVGIDFVIDRDNEDGDEDEYEERADPSMFNQAISTIEAPEAGEEFPEEVEEQLGSAEPLRAESLLGER